MPTTVHAWLACVVTVVCVAELAERQITLPPVLVLRHRMSARRSPL
jgi:hypothetical protein